MTAVPTFTPTARWLGMASAAGTTLLTGAYTLTLAAGLRSLASPLQPIGDPYFAALEILILLLVPCIVVLLVAVHAWAPAPAKVLTLTALVFACLLAGVTCSLHFVILTVGRHPALADAPGLSWLLSFTWPSVAYALDILAWDVFFALAVLFAAPAFGGSGLAKAVRVLLVASGALALAGLSGVAAGDMGLRNIGILGYAVVFPVATASLGLLFYRTEAFDA
jgi:hypothetical protein